MTGCPRVLLHSKDMQRTALTAEEKKRKKGRSQACHQEPRQGRPAATLSRRWARSCASSLWTSSSGSSGAPPYALMAWQRLEDLRWSRTLKRVPILTMTHRARRAPDISTV